MTEMETLNQNEYQIEKDEYLMQNNEEELKPQKKKLRKLKKNKKTLSDDENIIGQEDENLKDFYEEVMRDIDEENVKSKYNNTESGNEINNQFEKSLFIQGNVEGDDDEKQQQKVKPATFKSKLDELSEQIAQMDAEKEAKNKRKSNKKKNVIQENELIYFDDDEEKKIAEKSEKKQRVKKVKEKKELEKNEDIVKRLTEKFNDEEEDNYEINNGLFTEDIDDEYEINPDNKKNKKNKKDPKAKQNPNIVKIYNKFFKEIDLLEQNTQDNIKELPDEDEEEQEIIEESIQIERINNKNQKNIQGFLKQSLLYKKLRGLEFNNPETKLKETCISQEKSMTTSQSKQVDQNNIEEEQKEQPKIQIEGENENANQMFFTSSQMQNSQEFSQTSLIKQINGESSQDFSNIQKQISSVSNAVTGSQDKKTQLLKQTSLHIQKILSSKQQISLTQTSSSSMNQSKIGSMKDDDFDIELHVPTVDSNQKHQSLINNTLFFNKVMRTGNQNLFVSQQQTNSQNQSNKQIPVNGDTAKNNNKQPNNQNNNPAIKKQLSRSEYLKSVQQRITERKSQNIDLSKIQNIFRQTTFEHFTDKKDKKSQKQAKDSNQDTTSSDNKTEEQNTKKPESNNDDNDSQNTENDSDYDPINNSGDEGEENQNEIQEDDEEKKRQLQLAEIQYRKLLALEEGVNEKDFEKQIRQEYGLEVSEEEDESDYEEQNEENGSNKEKNVQEEENNYNEKMYEENLEKQLEDYEDEQDKLKVKESNMMEEDEKRSFKRLKNIAVQILKKQQEKKEQEKIRQQKAEGKKQLMNNPLMKKMLNDMIDDEAELGSDNEDNDHVVKNVGNEDERKEAGLNENEDLDGELEELIDNQVQIDEDNEQLAAMKFNRDLAKKDKEEIAKIIEGAYKGTRANKRNLSDLLDDEGNNDEAKKLKRIQEAIINLQEQGGGDELSDEDEEEDYDLFDPLNSGQKKTKSKGKRKQEKEEENEQMKIREYNLLLKKEYKKVSDQIQFDEKKLIDSSLLDLYKKKQTPAVGQNNNENINKNGLNSKKIVPTKISDQVGVMKGNISLNTQSSTGSQNQKQQQQSGIGFTNLRQSNMKNSILHVKNNKNRFSQFNDSFNKESLLNEFGESALSKAFQAYADHSQSIFYSKEDSNSRPIEKNNSNNKLNKQTSFNSQLSGSGSSSNNFKSSSLNKLFKSNSVIASGPSPNSLIIFGKKKNGSANNAEKQQ